MSSGVACPSGFTSTGKTAPCNVTFSAQPNIYFINTTAYSGPVTTVCSYNGMSVCGSPPLLVSTYNGVNYYAHVLLGSSGNFVVNGGN